MVLEVPWAPLDQTSENTRKIFSFCPSSSLEKWGLQYSPPSRVTVHAVPGSLLALPMTKQLYRALLNSLHIFQLLFLEPVAVFLLMCCSLQMSKSVSLFVENTDFYKQYHCEQCLGEVMCANDSLAC